MQRFRREIILVVLLVFFLAPRQSGAQELIQISIAQNESFYVHSAENVSIFSDLKNSGSLGSYSNSTISFFGQRWTNMAGSRIVDESQNGQNAKGGNFKFRSSTNSLQFIDNKNTASNVFPNLTLANTGDVMLEGNDLVIRGNLNFENGHLILNNKNAVLSQNATITGFDNMKFVVTGTAVDGGYLVRNSSGISQTDLIFPVGTTVSSYTPTALNHKGIAQNIKVRVFDNVYDKATLGTPNNISFVPKTWNVSFALNDPTAVLTLKTQHNGNEEGPNFASNRDQTFLSRYSLTSATWDKIPATSIGTGTITSGATIANAYIHTRAAISSLATNEYFAKSTATAGALSTLRIPAGISPNNDGLNEKFVIENLKPSDNVRLDIYNRWQTLVFHDGNYKNTFDGIGNQKGLVNNELPDGTYYYILNINGEKPITGYIIINR